MQSIAIHREIKGKLWAFGLHWLGWSFDSSRSASRGLIKAKRVSIGNNKASHFVSVPLPGKETLLFANYWVPSIDADKKKVPELNSALLGLSCYVSSQTKGKRLENRATIGLFRIGDKIWMGILDPSGYVSLMPRGDRIFNSLPDTLREAPLIFEEYNKLAERNTEFSLYTNLDKPPLFRKNSWKHVDLEEILNSTSGTRMGVANKHLSQPAKLLIAGMMGLCIVYLGHQYLTWSRDTFSSQKNVVIKYEEPPHWTIPSHEAITTSCFNTMNKLYQPVIGWSITDATCYLKRGAKTVTVTYNIDLDGSHNAILNTIEAIQTKYPEIKNVLQIDRQVSSGRTVLSLPLHIDNERGKETLNSYNEVLINMKTSLNHLLSNVELSSPSLVARKQIPQSASGSADPLKEPLIKSDISMLNYQYSSVLRPSELSKILPNGVTPEQISFSQTLGWSEKGFIYVSE